MKYAAAIFPALLALTSCSNGRPSVPVQAEAPPKQEEKKADEVTMQAASQAKAGLAVEQVAGSEIPEVIRATGQLNHNEDQTWMVGALMDGRIVRVTAKVGDTVRQGQVLAQMHSHDVHDARASYKKAKADLAKYEAAEAQARRLRDRARRLLDLKAASQQDVELAEAELRNAQAAVESARIELEKEKTHIVEFLDVPLDDDDRDPNRSADFIPIKSPAAGVIIERKATAGSVVSTGDEVFKISNLSALWMIANVNEADLSHLRPGQPVRVLVRAYPEREFTGRILRLGEQLDPTTRTLQVRVLVPNPGGLLKPEMYASAEIQRPSSREALYVPESASQDLNGHRVVFVRVAPDRFAVRPIEVARVVEGKMEVTAGLRSGDSVVTKGSFLLKSELLKGSLQEQ